MKYLRDKALKQREESMQQKLQEEMEAVAARKAELED